MTWLSKLNKVVKKYNPAEGIQEKAADISGKVWKPLGNAGHWGDNHPGEVGAAVGAVFGGAALMGGAGAGGAGGAGAAGAEGGAGLAGAGGGTAMGGSAGTLGAVDSSLASSQLGLTAADVGGMGAAGGAADVGGLAAADSAAVDAEGAEPGLTQGYGSSPSGGSTQQQMPQQKKRRPKFDPVGLIPSANDYAATVAGSDAAIAQSSKKVKTRGATQAAMQRGLQGAHPVDTNGVHIAAIQELHKQIESLGARIAAIKAKRAGKGASA